MEVIQILGDSTDGLVVIAKFLNYDNAGNFFGALLSEHPEKNYYMRRTFNEALKPKK